MIWVDVVFAFCKFHDDPCLECCLCVIVDCCRQKTDIFKIFELSMSRRTKRGASPIITAACSVLLSTVGIGVIYWGATVIYENQDRHVRASGPTALYSADTDRCPGGRIAGKVENGVAKSRLFESGWNSDFDQNGEIEGAVENSETILNDPAAAAQLSGNVTVNLALGCWTVEPAASL